MSKQRSEKKKRKNVFHRMWSAFKKWKTSKTVLFTAIIMCILYTAANCVFSVINVQYGTVFSFDSTLTSEWFEFWKWVVISGGSITVAKVVKGKHKSDEKSTIVHNDEEVQG